MCAVRRLIGCRWLASMLLVCATSASAFPPPPRPPSPPPSKPNILVIVLDDIGIDQSGFAPFGWDASSLSPDMPVLESIATHGVSFTNFWATPECSPTRAAMLTGRLGFRTGVVTAIVDPMLPVDQLHPAEITLPKLLGPQYRTAMIGKYHLGGGPENTPPGFGYQAPATTCGFDFYDGYWDLPPSIDTTIGGQVPPDSYSCGGLGGLGVVGAACFPDGTCIEGVAPFEAMAMGGTPLLDASGNLAATCADGSCAAIDFSLLNAYYAWERVTTASNGMFALMSNPPQREYLTSFISRRSREWINAQHGNRPWLVFVTHSSAHTPIQPPPPSLSTPGPLEPDCSLANPVGDYRIQFKRMCESADRSVGEMLVELGLATEANGVFSLIDPAQTNTMIVVFGDNGSLGSTVLPPFAPRYAKQTVYQTGVWAPCIVAGPMVVSPDRAVDEMVNVVDLFGLIADAAGVDWQSQIPAYRPVDSRPMMPYLTDPQAPPQREFNYALYQGGTFAPGETGPCVIDDTLLQDLLGDPGVCTDNGGCWLGGADAPPYPITDYCQLAEMGSIECGGVQYCFDPDDPFCENKGQCDGTCVQAPTTGQWAVRSGSWKLIVLTYPSCVQPDCALQFYHMADPVPPDEPGLDTPGSSAQIDIDSMTPEEQAMFDLLRTQLYNTLASQWYCPGDGNKDFKVNALDFVGLIQSWGSPGFWDLNEDGTTNGEDLDLLIADLNPNCTGQVNPAGQGIPSCLQPAEP